MAGGACVAGEGAMHGGGHAWWGVCMAGGMHGRMGQAWQGACMAGGMHGRGMHGGGHVWQGGAWQVACMAGGACVAYTPPADTTRYGRYATYWNAFLFCYFLAKKLCERRESLVEHEDVPLPLIRQC